MEDLFFVYIIYSAEKNKYYVGHTHDYQSRLEQHCIRGNLGANDWKLKYVERFLSRSDAIIREKEIKNKKSRKYIERLIFESIELPA